MADRDYTQVFHSPGEEAVERFLEEIGYKTTKPSKYFIVAE